MKFLFDMVVGNTLSIPKNQAYAASLSADIPHYI